MGDDICAEHGDGADEPRAEPARELAPTRTGVLDSLLLLTCLRAQSAQQDRDANDRDEEDEFLAEGVETAEVERHRRDGVCRRALWNRGAGHHLAVARRPVAERVQPGARPRERRGDEDDAERADDQSAAPHFRVSSSRARCSRILPIASSSMSGTATVPMASSESATSGA